MRHSRRYGAPSSALVSRSRACRPEVGVPRPSPRFSQVALRRCAVLRTPRADRRRRPLAPMPPSGATRKHGNADLWPVLPVGAGTAPRSGASGVYHAAVRMMLNAEVPAERRATPELGVLPAGLRRAVPTGNPNSPDGAAGKGTPTSGRHRCAQRSERRVPRGSPDDAECRGPGREANHPRTRGPSLPPAYGGLCRPGTPTVQMAPLARERRPLVGTAARSAANGVYHAAVQMTLNAGVPAERRTTPELGVLLCRPPTAGCADRRSAFPCLRVAPRGSAIRALAGLRPAVPTGGRRCLAYAPPCVGGG